MPNINILDTISEEKITEIETWMQGRFDILDSARKAFDVDIQEEIDLFNDIDKNVEAKEPWEEQYYQTDRVSWTTPGHRIRPAPRRSTRSSAPPPS